MELDGLYRDIVERSPDGFWVLDLDGRTIYANPAMLALFGVDRGGDQPAHRLRLARRARPRAVRRAPRGGACSGRGNGQDVESCSCAATARRCGCWSARASCAAPDGESSASCTGSATTARRRRTLDELTREPAAAGRGAADRPDRQLGVGRAPATRSTGSEGLRRSTASTATRSRRPTPTFLDIVHEDDRAAVDARGAARPGRRRRVHVRGPGRGRATAWVWTRGRGRLHRDEAGEVLADVGHPPGHHRDQARRARARGPGPPERPHAGGRQRRQRGAHPRGRARPGAAPGAAPRRLGARPRLRARPRTAPASYRSTSVRRGPGRRRGDARTSRRWSSSSPTAPSRRRRRCGTTRGSPSRFPVPYADEVLRGRHDHLRAAALPLRPDPVDGRAGGRPARPGRRAGAAPSASSPTPATARWRRRGRSRSSWRP